MPSKGQGHVCPVPCEDCGVKTYHVSEVFHSIQGEGALAGMPSTFIRLAHCNLSCSWCDAAYTWKGNVTFEEQKLGELVEQVAHDYVVLTGGEPTYAEGFDQLVAALAAADKHVTVETNGTIWRDVAATGVAVMERAADGKTWKRWRRHVGLWSVSPKLGSSGQAGWLKMGVLEKYNALTADGRVQFKFVVDGEDDFAAVAALLRELQPVHEVFMQPNGLCHIAQVSYGAPGRNTQTMLTDTKPEREFGIPDEDEDGTVELRTEYLDRLRWLYERVVAADQAGELPCPVRAVPQSHKLAWGNKRGF